MSPKLLVIIGATGTQGGSVASAFLDDPAWRIRAITRDPTKPASQALAAKGVEVVRGDADDPASLRAAFKSAHAIFAVTDFWGTLMGHPGIMKGLEAGKAPNEVAYDIEIQHARNIFEAAAAEVDEEGGNLERFVFSSLPNAKKQSGGKYSRAYNFDSKAVAEEHLFEKLPALAKKTSLIYLGLYAENHLMFPPYIPRKDASGSFVVRLPLSPDAPFPYVIARTQTGHFVKRLINSDTTGIRLRGSGFAAISPAQFTRSWGKILGVDARFEEISPEEFASANGPPVEGQLLDLSHFIKEFGYFGREGGLVGPEEVGIEVQGVNALEEWIKGADWSAVIEGGLSAGSA